MPPTVQPLEPWQTAWPALPLLLLTLWGAWGLRKTPRIDAWLGGVLLLALLVRVLVLPIGRHQFDGHEAEYLDLFTGSRGLSRGGPMLYPAMQWLYAGLGQVFDAPWVLVGLNLGLSLLSIAALQGLVARGQGPRVGALAGVFLALWGNHAAWSSSAYNVILPHAMVVSALWALRVLTRGGEPLAAGALAGGALGLALATRLESALVLPPVALWLLLERPGQIKRWLPPLGLGLGLGLIAAALVLWPGQTPGEEQRSLAWANNLGLFAYFRPFGLWSLLLFLPGAALMWGKDGALALGMLALVLLTHVASASFEDYGSRHLLNAGAGLCVLGAALGTRPWGWPGVVVLLGVLGLDLVRLAPRYYGEEEAFAQTLDPALPVIGLEQLPACALICEDSRVVPEGQQRSHFNLWDPAEAEALRAQQGCLVWLRGVQDWRWSSRAVDDRALRLQHLYALRVVAVVKDDSRGYVAEVIEVGQRRDPGPLDVSRP